MRSLYGTHFFEAFLLLLVCVSIWAVRGNELFAAKDLAGAVAAYTEAISLDGSDAAFRSNRSAVHMSMGAHEQALVDAEVQYVGMRLSIFFVVLLH